MARQGTLWSRVSEKAIALFWALIAFSITVFGNGEQDLFSLVLWSPKLNRLAANLAIANILINIIVFVYLFLWLEGIRGVHDPLTTVSWAIPVGGVTLAVGVLSLMVALLPLFGLLSPFMVIALLYGFVMSFHFVPSFGILNRQRPAQVAAAPPRRKRMTRHEDSD